MTIYTCIFGPYDDLKEPLVITEGWQYKCFTNQPLKSYVWEIIQVPTDNERLTAKECKILPHLFMEDSKTIYIDASFIVNCDLNKWYEKHREGITFSKNPFRGCVYQEGRACTKKATIGKLKNQLRRFKQLGIPTNNGMVASGMIIRDGSYREFLQTWFEEYKRGCERDQIAWAYAHFKYPKVSRVINWDYRKGPEFLFVPHNNNPDKKAAKIQQLKKEYAIPY